MSRLPRPRPADLRWAMARLAGANALAYAWLAWQYPHPQPADLVGLSASYARLLQRVPVGEWGFAWYAALFGAAAAGLSLAYRRRWRGWRADVPLALLGVLWLVFAMAYWPAPTAIATYGMLFLIVLRLVSTGEGGSC